MSRTPFLDFHRAAEAAGYPALLIVTTVCLALVVLPVALLGLTEAGWVLALALLSLVAAVAILAGAIDAAMSDADVPARARTSAGTAAAAGDSDSVAWLALRQTTARQARPDRQAA